MFFVFLGIAIGAFLGIRTEMLNKNNSIFILEDNSGDNYIHALNIPIMEIDSLNPLLTTNKQVLYILNLIYEPLISINDNETLVPMLATEWAQKDDYNWIIKLRKDVRWHDGELFTAKDVVFTIKNLVSGEIDSIYNDNVKNILNVEKIDDYSISITLSEKDEFLMYKMMFPIIPEHYFRNGNILNENKIKNMNGTGPYEYASMNVAGDILKLEKNLHWWNNVNNSRLDTIYLYKYSTYGEAIKAYKSASVDLIVTTMSDWEKKFGTIGNNSYKYESSTFDMIIPNTNKPMLSDSSVRKAILTAINRENIVSSVFDSNAVITDLPIHTRSNNYLNSHSEYDLDKAKQILINAGWSFEDGMWKKQMDKKSYKLKFTLLVNSENDEHVKAAEIIKENLGEMGIGITLKNVKWSEYKKMIKAGEFELALASIDIKNELTILNILEENGELNYAKYLSEEMNQAIENVKSNYNTNTMNELQKVYKNETPYIGLLFRCNTLLTNKSVRGSIEPIWNNPFENISTWCK